MKRELCHLVITCLTSIICITSAAGQKLSPAAASTSVSSNIEKPLVTREEQAIRATYEKLTNLNRAARLLHRMASVRVSENGDDPLRFELRSFKVGPIQEIMSALRGEIATLPSGEILLLTRSTSKLNNDEERVAYEAEWTNGRYASVYDPRWTVADVLAFEPDNTYDVGEYASYEVSVFLKGRNRVYRALALFHNGYQSLEPLQPTFWDSIVGMGGVLTDVWNERRRLVGETSERQAEAPETLKSYAGQIFQSQGKIWPA